jgi:gamma-glutamylcyclotransferase (GGCT)/AIG2-like uncharacterized protein YtfP
MPFYFAYGSNMDETAMRKRCPNAKALGRARFMRHRFVLMGNGYASVCRDSRAVVHGVLFDLALSDVAPLDRYEEVSRGLYTKHVQPVLRDGGAPCQALIYFGTDPTTGRDPPPGYMEGIVEAARVAALPGPHIAMLESLVPRHALKRPHP